MGTAKYRQLKMSRTKICVLLDFYGVPIDAIKKLMKTDYLLPDCYYWETRDKGWIAQFNGRLLRRLNAQCINTNQRPNRVQYRNKEDKDV